MGELKKTNTRSWSQRTNTKSNAIGESCDGD